MVLILNSSEVLMEFEEYLLLSYEEVVYCLNEDLYNKLLQLDILVEMAFMKGGIIYTPLMKEYEGLVVIEETKLEESLNRYNINIDGWEKDTRRFIEKYPNITNQENILNQG